MTILLTVAILLIGGQSSAAVQNHSGVEPVPAILVGSDLEFAKKVKLLDEIDAARLRDRAVQLKFRAIDDSGLLFLIEESIFSPKHLSAIRLLLNEARVAGIPSIVDADRSPDVARAIQEIMRSTRLGVFKSGTQSAISSVVSVSVGVSISCQLTSNGKEYSLTWRSLGDTAASDWSAGAPSRASLKTDPLADDGSGLQIAYSEAIPASFRKQLGKRAIELAMELEEAQHLAIKQFEQMAMSEFMVRFTGSPNWKAGQFPVDKLSEIGSASLLSAMKSLPSFEGKAEIAEAIFLGGTVRDLKPKLMITVKIPGQHGNSLRSLSLEALLRG